MKRFLVFITSFTLLYFAFQIVSGMALTALYVPEVTFTEGAAFQNEVAFGAVSPLTTIPAVMLIATGAYFISRKMMTLVS
ncbi:hypothetical protein BEP19_12305 [Ammoniphilus oxalaticus]|uniref:Uncharacterized protein n=1 Tax=Ammoniphilus oxalaticus TaxID=66863 RepID=A0A419SGV9_9BACL|nr:hypothetical protein [Ammoniphilus oxalaticus]RKD23006.1 hypothetical protein BEP19_12305 [Ammoniphilus oxalaticus]